MKRTLVIWGASGHAKVVADVIRLQGEYEIVGFLDDVYIERHNQKFFQSTILGGREQLDFLQHKGVKNIIFGFGDPFARLKLSHFVQEKGFTLATAIHPHAIVADSVVVNAGTVIVAGAVINPGTIIDENVIVNTLASVDHDCVIGEGTNIGPGVHIGGNVRLGKATQVGIGATIINNIRVGSFSVIGAGSVVVKDIPDGVVAYGVPARIIKKVARNDNQ